MESYSHRIFQYLKMSPFGSRRWHRAILLFSVIFVLAVLTEFGVGWFYQYSKAGHKLKWSAEELKKYLSYSDHWNLEQLNSGEPYVLSYYILDSNGRNIDIQQFNAAMKLRIKPDLPPPGLQTAFVKETGETWRLLVKHLSDGMVILGIKNPEDITNVDRRLSETAELFGSSIKTALAVKTWDTDKYTDVAIVDDKSDLRFAVGGIPLRLEPRQGLHLDRLNEIIAEDGLTYGVFTLPFRDRSGLTVGMIATFDKIDPQPWFSLHHWIVNCLTSAILAFVGTLIGIPHISERIEPKRLLHNALQKGESATVEFKESLRWDKWHDTQQKADDTKKKESAEYIAIKNIVALLNNRTGGTLLIGVADDKSIVGLERDYKSLEKKDDVRTDRNANHDRFQRCLRDLLGAKIGSNISKLYIQMVIVEADGKDVCVVHANPAAAPVYLSEAKKDKALFFVRHGAATVELDVEQAVTYIEKRWPKALWRKGWNALRRS